MSAKVIRESDPTMSAIREVLGAPTPSDGASDAERREVPAERRSERRMPGNMAEKMPEKMPGNRAGQNETAQVSQAAQKDSPSKKGIGLKLPMLGEMKLPFRPARRQIMWGAVALLVLLRPHWFVLTVFLGLFVIIGVFAVFGAENVWAGLMRIFSRFVARSPERGQRMVQRLDAVAMRWDGFLDRFPEGSVDGLYLPDFQSLREAEERHNSVVDERLSRMQVEG